MESVVQVAPSLSNTARFLLRSAIDETRARALVDLASRLEANIELRRDAARARLGEVNELLSLRAEKGDAIEAVAIGGHAERALVALAALAALVEGDFDGALLPKGGVAEVEGIAIGRAVVWAPDPEPTREPGSLDEETIRMERAIARAIAGVEDLVRLLAPSEAELFVPERAILEELGPILIERVARGERPEQAVQEATATAPSDLLVDARARLLDGLALDERSVERLLHDRAGDRVLVTRTLAPSVVASLPARVVGIVAATDNAGGERPHGPRSASHAAILARGRDIPLALVSPEVAGAIADDDLLVVDTTGEGALLWTAPRPTIVERAAEHRRAWRIARAEDEEVVTAPLAHLGVEVQVNIGSLREHVPRSADGVGLVRTELLFADHARAPSEAEQLGALRAIALRAGRGPIATRLFDAGGDKPLVWLRAPAEAPDARGIALLLAHPALLEAQLRVSARAAACADVRVLVPFVEAAAEIEAVRALSREPLRIGAMVETPWAIARIESIAEAADFVCIGTNDLAAIVEGRRRSASTFSLDAALLRLVARAVDAAHACGRRVSVCGELAGDPQGARVLVGLGVDAISVAPYRFAKVKLALREVSRDDCRALAREATRA